LVQLLLPNGRTARVLAPVSGQVVSINEDLILDPMLLCKAPYSRGWICEISPSAANAELATLPFLQPTISYLRLMRAEPVSAWVAAEVEKLKRLLAGRLPDILTEGGDTLRANLPEVLSDEDWQSVTQAFLGA
jgi:hypothetical protein